MESVEGNETVDLVLTPQFYTFIRESLAIKFAYQAKNIADSLFDDYLDPIKEYQYHVYKCGEDWCFFAYDVEEITHFLEQKGISPYRIGKVYFAQELVHDLNEPIPLGNRDALQRIEDTVTVIPQRLLSTETPLGTLELEKLNLQQGVTLSASHDSFISMKQGLILSLLFLLLGGSFFVEGKRIHDSIEGMVAEKEKLLEENPKLGSSLIRNSELEKYKPINRQERLKRDTVSKISKMLSKKSHLKSLKLDDKRVIATIETDSNRLIHEIEKRAKGEHFRVVSKGHNEIVLEKKL